MVAAILIIGGIPLYFIIGLLLVMKLDHNNPPTSLEDALAIGDVGATLFILWPVVILFTWRIVFSH